MKLSMKKMCCEWPTERQNQTCGPGSRTRQLQILAQRPEQRHLRIDIQGNGLSIDCHLDQSLLLCGH